MIIYVLQRGEVTDEFTFNFVTSLWATFIPHTHGLCTCYPKRITLTGGREETEECFSFSLRGRARKRGRSSSVWGKYSLLEKAVLWCSGCYLNKAIQVERVIPPDMAELCIGIRVLDPELNTYSAKVFQCKPLS